MPTPDKVKLPLSNPRKRLCLVDACLLILKTLHWVDMISYLHSRPLYPWERSPCTNWIGGCMAPSDFVGVLEKRKYIAFTPGHPTHCLVTIPTELFWHHAKQIYRNFSFTWIFVTTFQSHRLVDNLDHICPTALGCVFSFLTFLASIRTFREFPRPRTSIFWRIFWFRITFLFFCTVRI